MEQIQLYIKVGIPILLFLCLVAWIVLFIHHVIVVLTANSLQLTYGNLKQPYKKSKRTVFVTGIILLIVCIVYYIFIR